MNALHLKPKRFLFATWEGGGNVAPALAVARKLVARGHRVRFLCDLASREEVLARGVEFRSWQLAPNRPDRSPDSCPVRDWEAASAPETVQRVLDKIMVGPALEYAQDLIDELCREPADLVVTSEMLLGVMAACESRGQPFALFASNLCIYPIPGMPAFGPGLPPPRNVEEEALCEQVRLAGTQMFDTDIDHFNGARARLGLAPLLHVSDQINAASRYLLGTSRAFDFPVERLPDKMSYVGPQLDEPAWVEPWCSPWEDCDRRSLIAIGFSTTFQNHAQVLQKALDAVASLAARAVVTLGQIKGSDLRAPANAALVASAPHDAVMREAAVVATHGGHGTVMRALLHKRPMLIIPHGRDQDENAARVVERGAGIRLPADASVEQVQTALRRLLEEPSFAQAAARLGCAIEAGVGDEPVEPLLESLACKRRERPLVVV